MLTDYEVLRLKGALAKCGGLRHKMYHDAVYDFRRGFSLDEAIRRAKNRYSF